MSREPDEVELAAMAAERPVTGAEKRAHSQTLGAVLTAGRDESGVPARAMELLDARDSQHLADFGHLPGQPGCTLAARADAAPAAMAALYAQQQGAQVGGTTQEVVDVLRARAPWLNVKITGEDPEVEAAREGLAQKVAAMHSGPPPRAGRIP